MKLKPRYYIKLCTDAGWQEPIVLDRDWKLKQYQDPDIRITLIDDAASILNVAMSQVYGWVVRVEMEKAE